MKYDVKMMRAIVLIGSLILNGAVFSDQSPQVLWANYSTFGMNDDGDFNHPTISIATAGIVHIYDIGQPVRYCPTESKYFCIYGHWFNIAIPKHNLKPTEQWHFAHTLFRVIPHHGSYNLPPPPPPPGKVDLGNAERFLSFLGEKINYYAIQAVPDDKKDDCHSVYLFSPNRGLIGLINHCDGMPMLIRLLEEQYGPGTAQFDSKIPASALLSRQDVESLSK